MATAKRMIKTNEARHMVITPKFRVSFPNVFKTKYNELSKKEEFSLDMIFDSEDAIKTPYKGKKKQTVSMAQAVANAKADQWGKDPKKWPKFKHKVFKDGNENKDKEGEIRNGYEDMLYCTAKSAEKYPPKVVGMDGKPLDEADFYGGCYAIAQLIARPYDFAGNTGVRFIVVSIQKVEDGEKFGGMSSAEDVFDVSEVEGGDLEGEGYGEGEDDADF